MTDVSDRESYEDADYIEVQKLPTMEPGQFHFLIRHKASGNMFRIRAANRVEMSDKLFVGDMEPDPNNTPDTDDDDDEE